MKKLLILLILTFPAAAADRGQIIATIDGQKITRGEIEDSLAEIAELVDGGNPKLETFPKGFQKEFIDKYIDKKLLVEAGRKAGTHKSKVIREKVRLVEDYLTQEKYLQDMIVSKTNNKALKNLYNEKYKKDEPQTEYKASHILVEEESHAKELKKKLDDGANFAELAKENSIEPGAKVSAGELGYFLLDKMVPTFSDAVAKMQEDSISEPVKTEFGWHIIKLEDKRERKIPSFNDAKLALETELARKIIVDKVEELRKEKKIEYKIKLEDKK